MEKKQAMAPAECLKMNIELADNGIIIRNPECEDEVTLATETFTHKSDGFGLNTDHSDEYKAIGKKVYDWLLNVVIPEHEDDLIITNFDLDIKTVAKGREF